MFLPAVLNAVADIMTRYQDTFLGIGQNANRSVTIILMVWFGAQVALAHSFDLNRFAHTMFLIALCWWILHAYPTFWGSITGVGHDLALRLNTDLERELYDPIQAAYKHLTDSPSSFLNMILSPSALMIAWRNMVMVSLVIITQVVATLVLATGFIIQCVLVILGPLFIPFLIVPKLDFLFWGWFKGFLQYSFYPVVANAIILVVVKLFTRSAVFTLISSDPTRITESFGMIATVFLLAILLMLKVPSIVNQLFAGQAVQDAVGGAIKSAATFFAGRLSR